MSPRDDPLKDALQRYLGIDFSQNRIVQGIKTFFHRPDAKFGAKFLVFSAIAWYLYRALYSPLMAYRELTTWAVEAGANAMELSSAAYGGGLVYFGSGAFSYIVTLGCTGSFVMMLFTAAVVAYPAPWRDRWLALGIGLPAVFALNVARLVSMGWMGLHAPGWYEPAHAYWWQVFLILSLGLGWLAWVHYISTRDTRATWGRTLMTSGLNFIAALALLAVAGRVTGLADLYTHVVWGTSTFLAALAWPGVQPSTMPSTPWTYGHIVTVLALFAATPHLASKRRMLGALGIGLSCMFTLQVLEEVLYQAAVAGSGTGAFLSNAVISTAMMALPVGAWFLWAQRHGAFTLKPTRYYACPECKERFENVIDHIQTCHKRHAHQAIRRMLQDHPELGH